MTCIKIALRFHKTSLSIPKLRSQTIIARTLPRELSVRLCFTLLFLARVSFAAQLRIESS